MELIQIQITLVYTLWVNRLPDTLTLYIRKMPSDISIDPKELFRLKKKYLI